MEILWAALAICALVSVTFYVLALSWQRMLRSHSRAIRALFQRLEALEGMEDPMMRRKIGELMPSPLEQVHILSFRLGERFWRDTLGATEQQVRHIHEKGTFIGSVKIEVWRSHAAITLRELLPQSKSAGWQTRTVDIYATDSSAPATLWELGLEPETNSRAMEPPSVELRYENGVIVLATRNWTNRARPEAPNSGSANERIVFRIPLDAEQLAQFRAPETDRETGRVESETTGGSSEAGGQCADAWIASFSHQDERQGVDWQLHIRDLNGRTASEHWTIMEPPQVRRVS
ncbi:MAG: hypothetical protein WBE86_14065 [Candidatus Acidiferrales bacterium]